ncbi:MAG: UDP-N-acetylmuramoyl-L-alanine--D-glutamate ligase [Luminiphilus sp.]|nr:UDP-N-acetylmuramoyl-L-alanine--D-glutamate ligase [Luminiphilus sp.]
MPSMIASTEKRMIFGLGATGRSVARWWRSKGVAFSAVDTRHALASDVAQWPEIDASEATFGDVDPALGDDITEMVVSPGIALDHPLVARAQQRGCRIRGDIDLFMEAVNAPVVGITGSNGKSTVTGLLGEMVAACGVRVAMGGNFGTPALDLLEEDADMYVLELSSFQLERAEALGLRSVAVLNLSADHLDRYPSLVAYHRAKHKIFEEAQHVVANRDDPLTIPLMSDKVPVTWWRVSEPDLHELGLRDVDGVTWICRGPDLLLSTTELKLAGRHNHANVLAALALGVSMSLPLEDLLAGAAGYRGLPHRCQFVASVGAVTFIDDSKGTNIGATLAALEGLGSDNDIWLILGGQGKGQDFSLLRKAVAKKCAGLFVIGEATSEIVRHLSEVVSVVVTSSLEMAVSEVAGLAQPGQTVLLSPACASLDMFQNYVARGKCFQNAVSGLEAAA